MLTCLLLSSSACKNRGSTPDWPQKEPAKAVEKTTPAPKPPRISLPDKQGELPVRFIAYNLRNYLSMERIVNGRRSSSPKPEKEIAAIVSILSKAKPDVLGICEIGTQADLNDFQARLQSAGLDLPYAKLYAGSDPYRRQAILSRYPLIAHPMPNISYKLDGVSLQMNRGILDVTIQLPGGPVRFLGVHLKSKRETPKFDQEMIRRNEAHLLSQHAAKLLKDPALALLVYGDFNDTRQSNTIRSILNQPQGQQALNPLDLAAADGSLWTQFWDYQDVYSRFDYIFVSDALEQRIDKSNSHIITSDEVNQASDHRPLYLEIR